MIPADDRVVEAVTAEDTALRSAIWGVLRNALEGDTNFDPEANDRVVERMLARHRRQAAEREREACMGVAIRFAAANRLGGPNDIATVKREAAQSIAAAIRSRQENGQHLLQEQAQKEG